eukprot:781637-Pyramimonas_sp.AAC.1
MDEKETYRHLCTQSCKRFLSLECPVHGGIRANEAKSTLQKPVDTKNQTLENQTKLNESRPGRLVRRRATRPSLRLRWERFFAHLGSGRSRGWARTRPLRRSPSRPRTGSRARSPRWLPGRRAGSARAAGPSARGTASCTASPGWRARGPGG